jgi:hypothetical protein
MDSIPDASESKGLRVKLSGLIKTIYLLIFSESTRGYAIPSVLSAPLYSQAKAAIDIPLPKRDRKIPFLPYGGDIMFDKNR